MSNRARGLALALVTVGVTFAGVPAPTFAAITVSSAEHECIFQQHWESRPSGGDPYINVDRGNCYVDITWSSGPEVCPPTPQGQDGRYGGGTAYQKFYFHSDFDVSHQGQYVSGGLGTTWTFKARIGVAPTTSDLFDEVDGEKVVGIDEWKVRVQCFYGGVHAWSATESITIIVRGPNYQPPPGGGGGGGGGGVGDGGGAPPPPRPCPQASGLNAEGRWWNTHAMSMTTRANEANAEVIRLAEEARDAFIAALGVDDLINPAKRAQDKVVDETIAELDRLAEIAALKRIEERSVDRAEVVTLFRLKGYFEKLKVADKALKRVALVKGLYLLGLAAQKGVERDAYRREASEALAISNLRLAESNLAFQRCQSGQASRAVAVASSKRPARKQKKSSPRYTRLVSPQRVLALHVSRGSGLRRGDRSALNALMLGEQNANALQRAVVESLRRAGLARKAKQSSWESRQIASARRLAGRLAGVLENQSRLRTRLATSLAPALRAEIRLGIRDAGGLAAALRRLKLPTPVRQLVKLLGQNGAALEQGWRKRPTGGELVSSSLASVVGDPVAIARDRARSEEWRAFARGG